MSEMPDRMWIGPGYVGSSVPGRAPFFGTEYIRADLHTAAVERADAAERERIEWVQRGERAEQRCKELEAKLAKERERVERWNLILAGAECLIREAEFQSAEWSARAGAWLASIRDPTDAALAAVAALREKVEKNTPTAREGKE